MATPIITCTCGHPADEHPELGACQAQCQCSAYIELCPTCRHSTEVHNGIGGKCTRIKRDTLQPCGCLNYPIEQGS